MNDSVFFANISEVHYTTIPALSMALIIQEVLFGIVCLVGLVGNTLVIYVVIRFSKMQTVTNMYIVNLAIADECFLIGIPFLLVTMINGSWIFGEFMCKAYLILTNINQYSGSIFLLIMSADRYIAVCHPISSKKWRTPFILKIVSICAWTCSLILIIPIFRHSKQEEYWIPYTNVSLKSCAIVWNENSTESEQRATTFILYSFVFSFAIPFCLIIVFYCLIIQRLKSVGSKNKSKEKKHSHQQKVTNLVLTVVTVYVLCWLPYWIIQITATFTPSNEGPSEFIMIIHFLAFCLSYSNSAMNPILYAFLSDNFKKSFLKACTCTASEDVNAALHLENNVFPRKSQMSEDDCDAGLLVSKSDASTAAITLTSTSRSNINFNEMKEK